MLLELALSRAIRDEIKGSVSKDGHGKVSPLALSRIRRESDRERERERERERREREKESRPPRAQALWLGRYSGRSFFRPRRLGKPSGHGARPRARYAHIVETRSLRLCY